MASMSLTVGQTVRSQQSVRSQRSASRVQCAALPPVCQQQKQQQQPQQRWSLPGASQLAAGLAAAFVLYSAPANAGVIFEERQLKKVFQSEPVEAVKKAAAVLEPKGPAEFSAPSLSSLPSLPNLSSGNLSLLALPLAIGGLVGGAFAWRLIDPGFAKFFDDALCKNSNNDGAGYEFAMKTGSLPDKAKKAAKTIRGGTKKIAKKAAKKGEQAKKKGIFSF